MGRKTHPREAAATEIAAYDVLDMLIRRDGAADVLATLRCWYVAAAGSSPIKKNGPPTTRASGPLHLESAGQL